MNEKNEKLVLLPDIGDFKQVPVIELMVKVGDIIKADQSIVTLETEKATMEIPAPYAGKVSQLFIKLGDKVSKGDKILSLEADASVAEIKVEAVATATEAVKTPVEIAVPAVAPVIPAASPATIIAASPSSVEIYAGPATRRLARELGLSLEKVQGTGPRGRILTTDVHSYVKQALTSSPVSTPMAGIIAGPVIDFKKFGPIEEKALSRIKRLTATNLHRNWISIPHVTQFDEVDITELEVFRKAQQPRAEKSKAKLTLLLFVMKALVQTLKAFPQFNASLSADGQNLIFKKYYHIGIAVDTPNGLVVPVIRNVDQKSLIDLALELGTLSAKAREGKLSADDMQGNTFTISSLGGVGGTAFTPIINAPDVAILGLSKMAWKPVYQDEQFVARLILPLSLSYDHRVIDGAEAARFTSALVQHLNDIRTLLL
jgi:pyruvate dehydrogenase E2 component (dihydrolipoamide acetyltransferase)